MRPRLRRRLDCLLHRHHLGGGRGHRRSGLLGGHPQLEQVTGGQQLTAFHDPQQREQPALGGGQRRHRLTGRRTPRGQPPPRAASRGRERLSTQPPVAQERQRRQERGAHGDRRRNEQRPHRGAPRRQQRGHPDPEHGAHREEHAQAQGPTPLAQHLGPGVGRGVQLVGQQFRPLGSGVHAALCQRPPGVWSAGPGAHDNDILEVTATVGFPEWD